MSSTRSSRHGLWSSRWAFILAATGSAVGLGNIWRFPYLASENGGGIFVLVYLGSVFLVGLPILIAEIMLGRRGRQNPINTLATIAHEEGLAPAWRWLGGMGILIGIIIISYYSVIAGWVIAYIFRLAGGWFDGVDAATSQQIFADLIADPEKLLAWHTVFIGLTLLVVARGVHGGIERAVRFLMPAFFVILIVLIAYAATTEQFMHGIKYLFLPDLSNITDKNIIQNLLLPALGQAFFSLSIGMGAIMIYGAYMPQDYSIVRCGVIIVIADTVVALLAGIAIFPIMFSYGLEPAGGPGLVFISLPIAFGHMPFGSIFGTLFFILLLFAAWTSAISLIEPAVTWVIERYDMHRMKAAAIVSFISWFLGIATVLSFNHWQFSFTIFGQQKEYGIFDLLDTLAANLLLPIGGLLMVILAAWCMSRSSTMHELNSKRYYAVWRFSARYLAPIGVLLILLNAIGVLS